jgi:hypothetical protein|tara:strand:+ start:14312 stop:14515 length:204 start_codon:yes stop_codon:yes gene_type:complete
MDSFKNFINLDSPLMAHDPDKKKVTICAYCDHGKEESKKWSNRGYTEISHGICDACSEEQLRQLEDL